MGYDDLAPLWKALADPKRRRIIELLQEKAYTTGELCTFFDVSRFAVMQHLKVLEQAALIKSRREGRQRWNFLNESLFQQVYQEYLDDSTHRSYQLPAVIRFLTRPGGAETKTTPLVTVQQEVLLQATPAQLFQALTQDINAWWSHRIAPDSQGVCLEPWVGGRFYEAFDTDGHGVLYATVTYVKPGEELRLSGSMGLVDEMAISAIRITLHAQNDTTTRLQLAHRFAGAVDAATVDVFKRSWQDLLEHHLKLFVEQGICYQPPL